MSSSAQVGPSRDIKSDSCGTVAFAINRKREMPDILTVRLFQAGAVLVMIFQTAYLVIDAFSQPEILAQLLPFHVLNIAVGIAAFMLSRTRSALLHWRGVTLGAVAIMLATTTWMCALAHTSEAYYDSLALTVIGVAALMPWEVPWQTALNCLALISASLVSSLVPDRFATLHWVTVIVAVGVAQSATALQERYRQQVDAARKDALAGSEAKSGFLSSMSHEIRTPMNAIIGLAEVMKETQLNPEQQRYVDTMLNNGRTLLDLINNVLDLAKIEAGRLTPVAAEFDVVELVEQVAEALALRAHEKRLELTVRVSPEVPNRVIGDALRVRQILLNLLGNAIKFTEAGEVSMTVQQLAVNGSESRIGFVVSDTGPGIDKSQHAKLFSIFTQLDSSTRRTHEGSGLGLSIVWRLTELLGGTVSLESEIGKGSRFNVVLPLRPGSVAQANSAPNFGSTRVLIVDDNATNRLIMREIMASAGAIADEADNGTAAIDIFRAARECARPYDILLIDCRMPGMNGFELAQRLQSEIGGADPIIMMPTSDELNPDLRRLSSLGLDLYLVKPVKRRDLLIAMQDALASRLQSPRVQPTATPIPSPQRLAAKPIVAKGPRILFAEDNASNRLVVLAYLKKSPYEIEVAENGAVAISKFISGNYSLILMDMHMPVVDGYEAVKAIRQWERQNQAIRTPIIALTAAALSEDRYRAIEAGCDVHVAKPVSKATLLEFIEATLKRMPKQIARNSEPRVHFEDVDPALLAELTRLFKTESQNSVGEIRAAMVTSESEVLQRGAHTLKSSAAAVGARRLMALCQDLESAIASSANHRIKALCEEVEAEVPLVCEELENRVSPESAVKEGTEIVEPALPGDGTRNGSSGYLH